MQQRLPLPYLLLFILIFPAIISVNCTDKTSTANTRQNGDTVKATVVALHERAVAALNKGDLQNLMSVYAEDVILMPPNQSPRVGKTSVEQMWENVLSTYTVYVKVKPEEVEAAGNWAFERGTFEMTLNPKAGGPLIADTGKYLDILKVQPDGNWKYFRLSYSSNR